MNAAVPLANARPCPPSPFGVNGGSSASTQCERSNAPAWFTNLPERVWTDVAGGSNYSGAAWQKGARLIDVAPNPLPPGGSGHDGIIKAWNGATVAQGRGEYIKAAEGGHADYAGNEIYALRLRDEVPAWQRIWGPTPNNLLGPGTGSIINEPYITNDDGTPKTMHGWYTRQFSEHDERIWLLATNEGGGNWTTDTWSIPRGSLGPGVVTPSLWVYHGRTWTTLPSSMSFQAGPTAYDPVARQIMLAAEYADSQGVRRIDCAAAVAAGRQSSSGPLVPGTTQYNVALGGNPFGGGGWSVITTNTSPRCWIAGSSNDNLLYVWNLEAPGQMRTKSVTGGTIADLCGAAYHAPSRKIIIGGPPNITANLRTLTVPADPWNATSGFNMSTLTAAGGSVSAVSGFNGTYSQFQMINDMGNGQACIVMHTRSTSQPTYVYKLPAVV